MKSFLSVSILLIIFHLFPNISYAIDDPLTKPNNKFGIHILFTSELEEAAKLVNSNGGEWGYVTIPLQSNDKDLIKWQDFMDNAKRLKMIPIIRLATENDYFNNNVWRKPTFEDIVDFANFLNSLHWPTINKYVIIFNEVNRADEWGGKVDPAEYAQILKFAYDTFKSRDPNFFIISAGLDNAAPNQGTDYMNQFQFLSAMVQAIPDIFLSIDGISSHSYPNPGFSQPPSVRTKMSITSYYFEKSYIKKFTNKNLPIFITETGWADSSLNHLLKAQYFSDAINYVWIDKDIVAITPFLLNAGDGPFKEFSFLTNDGKPTEQYKIFQSFPKIKGQPLLNMYNDDKKQISANLPKKSFSIKQKKSYSISKSNVLEMSIQWILKL